MKKLLGFIALMLFVVLCPQLASAASQRNPCYTTDTLTTNGVKNCIDVGTNTPLPVTSSGGSATSNQGTPNTPANAWPVANQPYPSGATAITGNASGTTGSVVGTLTGAAAKTTYICGFNVSGIGSAAGNVGPIIIAGLVGSSQTYQASIGTTGTIAATAQFTPCIPANAVNTPITITTTADGTATAVNVNSWGFQQ